jgi:excisionase family DNA binding protein
MSKKWNYIKAKEASEKLGISVQSLRMWADKGKIESIRSAGNHRLYNVEKYLSQHVKYVNNRKNICYVRESTNGQKEDLIRQKKYMRSKYPKYEIIEDIGSGINFNRKGLRRIIKMAIEGKIKRVVVAYKDRLTRFGFEFIEDLIKEYSRGEIIIDGEDKDKEPKEELVEDVLQILNVYTAKMNGLRKYTKNNTKL